MAPDNEKREKLEKTIDALQQKWGRQSIQRLREHQQDLVPIPTGFEILDEILGIGGIPSGRISEIRGRPSSGSLTLALQIAANFPGLGDVVLFFDLNHCFDPEFASNRGVNLGQLVIVRPDDFCQGTEILLDLVMGGGKNLFLFDLPPMHLDVEKLSTTLDRLIAPLGQSGSTLIFINQQSPLASARQHSQAITETPRDLAPLGSIKSLQHYASVRLLVVKIDWLYQGKEIRGYRSRLQVIKNKVAPPGKEAAIAIDIHQNGSGRGSQP